MSEASATEGLKAEEASQRLPAEAEVSSLAHSASTALRGGGSKVREATTGRYVFRPFEKQLKDRLAEPQNVSGFSVLDLIHLQRKKAPIQWKRGLLDKEERERQRRRIETLESSVSELVSHLLQGTDARGAARQFLLKVQEDSASLPLLLLNKVEVTSLTVEALQSDSTLRVALQVLPALAKDLRSEFLNLLEDVFSGLHALLYRLERRADAEGVDLAFKSLSQICRYLQTYLAADMDNFLFLVSPLLLHLPAPQVGGPLLPSKRRRPSIEELSSEAPRGEMSDAQTLKNAENEEIKERAVGAASPCVSRSKSLRKRTLAIDGNEKTTKNAKVGGAALLAAQAVASVLRRAASESDSFFVCVEAVLRFFLKIPEVFFERFAMSASQLLFESIRGVEGQLGSVFEGLCCFLASTVLLQRAYSLPGSDKQFRASLEGAETLDGREFCCVSKVYFAQVSTVLQFFEKVQRHAGCMSSQAAVSSQKVTLRLLEATIQGWISHPVASEQDSGASDEEAALACGSSGVFSLSFGRVFCLNPFAPFTELISFEGKCRQKEGREGETRLECTSHCLPAPFLVGTLTLLDASACWFVSIPRLTGDFGDYTRQLLETLVPFCTAGLAGEAAMQSAPLLLQPLEKVLTGGRPSADAASLLIPSAVLRVLALCWRALPVSFAKALAGGSNLISALLTSFLETQRRVRKEAALLEGLNARPFYLQRALGLSQGLTGAVCAFLDLALNKPSPVSDFSSIALLPSLSLLCESAICVKFEARRDFSTEDSEDQRASIHAASWRWGKSSALLSFLLRTFASPGESLTSAATASAVHLSLKVRVGDLLVATRLHLWQLLREIRSLQTSAASLVERRRCVLEALQLGFSSSQWLHALVEAGRLKREEANAADVTANSHPLCGVEEVLGGDLEEVLALQQTHADIVGGLLVSLLDFLLTERNERKKRGTEEGQAAEERRQGLVQGQALVLGETLHNMVRVAVICAGKDQRFAIPGPSVEVLEEVEKRMEEMTKSGFSDRGEGACVCFEGTTHRGDAESQAEVLKTLLQSDESRNCPVNSWIACLLAVLTVASRVFLTEEEKDCLQINLLKSLHEALRARRLLEEASDESAFARSPLASCVVRTGLSLVSSGSSQVRLYAVKALHALPLLWLVETQTPVSGSASGLAEEEPDSEAPQDEGCEKDEAWKEIAEAHFEGLEKLLSLRVDLSTEREAIGLIEDLAVKTLQLQRRESFIRSKQPDSTEQFISPLVEISYRALVSQLSVKLATIWPRTVEAVSQCLEETYRETVRAGSGDKASTEAFQQRSRCLLEFVWGLIQRETHRALGEMTTQAPVSPKPETNSSSSSSSLGLKSQVIAAWEQRMESESVREETDPLSRHSSLLRIIQRVSGFVGKSFSPRRSSAGRSSSAEGATGKGNRWKSRFAGNVLRFLLRYALSIAKQLTALNQNQDEEGDADEDEGAVALEGAEEPHAEPERICSVPRLCSFLASSISLIPRANDLFRAIVAFGDIDISGAAEDLVGPGASTIEESSLLPNEAELGDADEEEIFSLWKGLLSCCAQELVGVRDASFQVLVLKVLLLSKELRPILLPYAAILQEALNDKRGTNPALLTLLLGKEEAEEAVTSGKVELSTSRTKAAEKQVVLLPEHRSFVVPLIIRLLLSKAHAKLGRSAGTVLANRKRIYGLLSSLASEEIPLMLAVMALRLVSVQRTVNKDSHLAGGFESLSGFRKERALAEFIALQALMAGKAESEGQLKQRFAVEEATRLQVRVIVSFNKGGDLVNASRLHGQLKALVQMLALQKHVLRPAAPFLTFLLTNCLDRLVTSATRSAVVEAALESSSESLEDRHENEEEKEEAGSSVAETETAEQKSGISFSSSSLRLRPACGQAPAFPSAKRLRSRGTNRKHCVRLCLEGLRILLNSFPDLAASWASLLLPGKKALQLLLEAAVETGITNGVNAPRNSKASRSAVPGVVSFVCSFSQRAEYFYLFEELLPNALPTLISIPRHPTLLNCIRRLHVSSTPMLEALVEAILLLSYGGQTLDQQAEEAASLKREFYARRKVFEAKRRQRGYVSSSDEEDADEAQEEIEAQAEEAALAELRISHKSLLEMQRSQQEAGLRVLGPYVGSLLAAFEILFLERRAAGVGSVSRKDRAVGDSTLAFDEGEDKGAAEQAESARRFGGRASDLVSVGELKLLSRLAVASAASKKGSGELSEGDSHSPCLVRLLLCALPQRVKTARAASRQQLTLEAIKSLLPSIALSRASLACSMDSPSSAEGLSELRSVLASVFQALCKGLLTAEDIQCRALIAETLLATELAAQGCVLTQELRDSLVKPFAAQLSAAAEAEEAKQQLNEEDISSSPIAPILPGGSLTKALLDKGQRMPSLLSADTHECGNGAGGDIWRVSVALALVCLNFMRSGGGGSLQDQRPDDELHLIVLSTIADRHVFAPSLSASQGGVSAIPGAALDPLTHHAVFLLSEGSESLTLQQVALGFLRKSATALAGASSAAATIQAAREVSKAVGGADVSEASLSAVNAEADWRFAVKLQDAFVRVVIPQLRRLLHSLNLDAQRVALEAFEAFLRAVGPAAPLLPSRRSLSQARSSSAEFASPSSVPLSAAEQRERDAKLHLDLYALMAAPKLNAETEAVAACAAECVASGDWKRAGEEAAKAASLEALAGEQQASEREEAGDLFVELLNLQKHRRSRAIVALRKAIQARRLCPSTLRHFCLPLALSAVLQPTASQTASLSSMKRKARPKTRTRVEAFDAQLAEFGVACVAQCCAKLPWKDCMQTIRQLASFQAESAQREGLVHRAISETLKAFPFALEDAIDTTLGQASSASMGKTDAASERGSEENLESTEREVVSSEVASSESAAAADGDSETNVAEEALDEEPSAEARLKRRLAIQRSIKEQLIPLLYKLAFKSKKRKAPSKDLEEVGTEKTHENPVVRPSLVAVILSLARILPVQEFHEQLPRLVRTIAVPLKSKDRSARREARLALSQLASSLGVSYFAYLCQELQRMVGPRSEKEKAAHAQGFQQPVLVFTLHAMLHALLHPREGRQHVRAELERESHRWKDALPKEGFSSTFVKPLEEAATILLPLVTEELNRVADPNRLAHEVSRRTNESGDFDAASSAVTTADGRVLKVEEARNVKGPSLLLMMTEHFSEECIEQRIIPFLYGLLSGSSGARESWCRAASYSTKYVNRVDDLFLHFTMGFSRNSRVPFERKLRSSKRLLLLTVAFLQYPLLHPIVVEGRSQDETLFTLISQQLALLQRRRRGPSIGEKPELASLDASPSTPPSLSPEHQEDLECLRSCMFPANLEETKKEEESDSQPETPDATSKPYASQCILALRDVRRDRHMSLQPGAATGRSLAQALQKQEARKGLELSIRASSVGRAALRLLLLLLKGQRGILKEFRWKEGEAPSLSLASGEVDYKTSGFSSSASNPPLPKEALAECFRHLNESATAVACCFASKINVLVSWGAKCLLELLGFRLAQLDRRGAFLAFTTLRIFQSSGTCSGGSAGKSGDSEVVPVCTKLLAVLMLRPKASRWLEGALNATQHLGGDLTRQLLKEQLELWPLRPHSVDAASGSKKASSSKCQDSKATLLLRVELPAEQQALSQRFFLKEALLSHISNSLEDPNLQLCALFLLKRIVLQHFREVAFRAAKKALEEEVEASGVNRAARASAQALQKERKKQESKAESKSSGTAGQRVDEGDAELLPRVYECVDRVGRVMIQYAASTAMGQKLTAVCSDLYVSFLLNFPMTPRTQQQRIFFLLQQQKYPEAEGRRAALTALQKVLRHGAVLSAAFVSLVKHRLPAELISTRYSQVVLAASCSSLAVESDAEAHRKLREVIREVLETAEVEDEPEKSLRGLLGIVMKLFLKPRSQHLLACLDFAAIFVEHCAKMQETNGLKAFLPELLSLLSNCAFFSVGSAAFPVSCSGDWRIKYKTLIALEPLLANAPVRTVEKAITSLERALSRFSTSEVLDQLELDSTQERQREGAAHVLASLEFWKPSCMSLEKECFSETCRSEGRRAVGSVEKSEYLRAGLCWIQLWREATAEGLLHENSWIRCAALRCVSVVLAKQFQTARSSCRSYLFPLLQVRGLRRGGPASKKTGSGASTPVAELVLALLQHTGIDDLLERHPDAAPLAATSLLCWIRAAFTNPKLFYVPRKERVRENEKALLQAHNTERRNRKLRSSSSKADSSTDQQSPPDERPVVDRHGQAQKSLELTESMSGEIQTQADSNLRQDDKEQLVESGKEHSPSQDLTSDSGGDGSDDGKSGDELEAQGEDASDNDESAGAESSALIWEALQSEGLKDELSSKARRETLESKTKLAAVSFDADDSSSLCQTQTAQPNSSALLANARVHPVLYVCRVLNRWLRVHLGSLGSRGRLGLQTIDKEEKMEKRTPGTVVRVSTILTLFHSIVSLLPLESLKEQGAGGSTQNAQKKQDEADPDADLSTISKVVRLALLEIMDACFRCSSLHGEAAADSLLLHLMKALEERDASAKHAEASPTQVRSATEGTKLGSWKQLRQLSPVNQLSEVAAAAKATLLRLEQRMRFCGVGELYASTLAVVQERVSERRVRRKLREKALLLTEPQRHAQRRRRRNMGKALRKKVKLRESMMRRHGFVKHKAKR